MGHVWCGCSRADLIPGYTLVTLGRRSSAASPRAFNGLLRYLRVLAVLSYVLAWRELEFRGARSLVSGRATMRID